MPEVDYNKICKTFKRLFERFPEKPDKVIKWMDLEVDCLYDPSMYGNSYIYTDKDTIEVRFRVRNGKKIPSFSRITREFKFTGRGKIKINV